MAVSIFSIDLGSSIGTVIMSILGAPSLMKTLMSFLKMLTAATP